MTINLWNIRKSLIWLESKLLGGTLAYSSGIIINIITDVNSMPEFLQICLSVTKPAILIMWILIAASIIVVLLSLIVDYLNKRQSPSAEFNRIMIDHTDSLLNEIGQNELSWGFNKNIHRSKDPSGWLPEAFYISEYEDNVEYFFPSRNDELPGYTKESYERFFSSPEMQKCVKKKNNKERFAVSFIQPNFNRSEKRVEIRIIKTAWIPLQFSWNYFRRIDLRNQLIPNSHLEEITKKMGKAFLDNAQGNDFAINSFCLHLILETKDGEAILAKISKNKDNDYPATWAATLGEQIEKIDFYDVNSNMPKVNFITNWVRRALLEEFDISDQPKNGKESEYDEIVNEKSLRVLSIDMEGDIYNIALTCVVKLKQSFKEFKENKGIWADSEESTELRACTLPEIREILLGYPNNSGDYHPSTYLRLLMFHLYKSGTNELCKLISHDYRRKKRL